MQKTTKLRLIGGAVLLWVCQTNCVSCSFHNAPSGTRSSPNMSWKLCSAGFQ